ncbi:MAG: hypothetical protein U0930_01880 [Pirellulales bacterium]
MASRVDTWLCNRFISRFSIYVQMYTDPMFGAESYAKWASKILACEFEARDFRKMSILVLLPFMRLTQPNA